MDPVTPYGPLWRCWYQVSFSIAKLLGREVKHSLPSSVEVNNECNCLPCMSLGREQGEFYLYYASSRLPVLGRVVFYRKTIFLTECRVLRDPHVFLFGISFLRISESFPSPDNFHFAFVQTGHIEVESVKVLHGRGPPPPTSVWHSRSSYHSSLQQRTCYGLDYKRIGIQFPASAYVCILPCL
jgi:hypothetical protein